mgnify:CR=1 FL=1
MIFTNLSTFGVFGGGSEILRVIQIHRLIAAIEVCAQLLHTTASEAGLSRNLHTQVS